MTRTVLLFPLALLLTTGCGKDDDTAPPEGDTDTDTDSDADGDTDADTDADADTDIEWEHCPDTDAYVGDASWTAQLEVTAEAIYCASYNEARTLAEELEAKALLRVVEGSYALPAEKGDYALALPVCTRRTPNAVVQEMDGTGSGEASVNVWSGTAYTYLEGGQPMTDGSAWELQHILRLVGKEGAVPDPLTLDGGPADASTGVGVDWYLVPDGSTAWDNATVEFVACNDDSWDEEAHTVTFDGGEVRLELVLGENTMETAPGRFTGASGTLDGESFEVADFFRLIYRPGHHHFTRHFAVIFDTPIGDACALLIEEIDPWKGDPTALVSTADCTLSALETREVTAETYEAPE